jgi:hypothetical protein
MAKILTRKKLSRCKAERVVTQTLDIAANHQLECLRRARNFEGFSLAIKANGQLKTLIDSFVHVLDKLPPASKGKINKIIIAQDWQHFDTEAFADLISALISDLTEVSPASIANEARRILIGGPKAFRTLPPAILELWETIPAQTRSRAEANIRSLPSCKSAVGFFRHVATVVTEFCPQLKMGRRSPIEQQFARRIATMWDALGLHVGRAYHSGNRDQWAHHYPSTFQRFCNLALEIVGDPARISGRQVARLRRTETQRA